MKYLFSPVRRSATSSSRRWPAAVGVIGASAGLAGSLLFAAQAASAAPAVPASPALAAAPLAVGATGLRLEPMGDSITYGYQSTTGDGYRGPLYNELTAEGYQPDFVGSVKAGTMPDPDNEGHSGWRIDQLAAITDSSLATYKPNVVTLMIGTNDLGQNYQVATAPDRLKALVAQIVNDDPTATVLVADLIVSTNTVVAPLRPAFNAAIPGIVSAERAAGKHVAEVDMSAVTTADLYDALHPNDTGYQIMADAWNKAVQAAAAAGWISAPVTGGAVAVVSGIAGKCLDVNGGSAADGTAVQLWGCNHSVAQSWTAESDGTLRALGKCLDATGGGTANGTKIELWDCNGGANQVWQPYDGGYRNSSSGRCLDDPGLSTTDGTQLDLWDCNGGVNQQWTLQPLAGSVTSGVAGKCLDDNADSAADGAVVDLWDCNNTAAQQWSASGGAVQINGKCLDATGGGTANGTKVELWDCNGGANQVWNYANNTLVNSASGRCLDDPGFSAANGTQLDLWDCNGGANQQWTSASL